VPCVLVSVMFLSAAAFGQTYLDYQGTGGNLLTASKLYVISDPLDPSTRTGTTRLPQAGDYVFVRNETTTTLSGTLTATRVYLGGDQVWPLGQTEPSKLNPSTMYIVAGGSMNLPLDSTGHFYPGQYYGGTVYQSGGNIQAGRVIMGPWGMTKTSNLYQLSGGTIKTGVNFYIGYSDGDDVKTSRLDMSGGYIDVGDIFGIAVGSGCVSTMNLTAGTVDVKAGRLHVGYGGSGTLNQTGGLINVAALNWSTHGDGDGASCVYNLSGGTYLAGAQTTFGERGGQATLNMTGGYLRSDTIFNAGANGATGVINISGGTFVHQPSDSSYWVWLGRAMSGGPDGGYGHMRITGSAVVEMRHLRLGGVFSDIWGNQSRASGRLTISQSAKLTLKGSIQPQGDLKENHTLEFLIGSASNFSFLVEGSANLKNVTFEITTEGGYTPSANQEWKIMTAGAYANFAQHYMATPDYELSIVGNDLMLKYTGSATLLHPGDANGDNLVNVGDLGILSGNWGGSGKTWAQGDFTGDGLVNVSDLGVLSGNWGWVGGGGGTQQVPEPATMCLLALGAAGLIRRRKAG